MIKCGVTACVVRRVACGAKAYMLIQRGKAPYKGMWGFPGGGIELGETSVAACTRELAEGTHGSLCKVPAVCFHFLDACRVRGRVGARVCMCVHACVRV